MEILKKTDLHMTTCPVLSGLRYPIPTVFGIPAIEPQCRSDTPRSRPRIGPPPPFSGSRNVHTLNARPSDTSACTICELCTPDEPGWGTGMPRELERALTFVPRSTASVTKKQSIRTGVGTSQLASALRFSSVGSGVVVGVSSDMFG